MKFILTLYFVIISSYLFSQEKIENFVIENNKLKWEKVYDSNFTREELITAVKNSGLIYEFDTSSEIMLGKFTEIDSEYKRAGYSEKTTPIHLRKNSLSGNILIEHKSGKFRVSIINVSLERKGSFTHIRANERKYLDDYAIQKLENTYTGAFTRAASVILNRTFDFNFDFSQHKINNNW